MSRFSYLLVSLAAFAFSYLVTPLRGQCCLGAQDQSVLSSNGRFRVVATSLTGTGPQHHGPYDFRFTMYRVAEPARDGGLVSKDVELGTFVRHWASREHFQMVIVVSPTGNGFLLGCSMQQEVQLLGHTGRVLRNIVCPEVQCIDAYDHLREKTPLQQHSVRLIAAGKLYRHTELWVPLGQIVGLECRAKPWRRGVPVRYEPIEQNEQPYWPILEHAEKRWWMSMLTWSPQRGEHDRAAVLAQLEKLHAEAPQLAAEAPQLAAEAPQLAAEAPQLAAADQLLALGLSALPVLRAALEQEQEATRRTAIASVIARIEDRLCGHEDPWRNRALLEVVADHPDEDLRNCARGRLRALDVR
jgi:hypothetical protein